MLLHASRRLNTRFSEVGVQKLNELDDLREIAGAASTVNVQGARYPTSTGQGSGQFVQRSIE